MARVINKTKVEEAVFAKRFISSVLIFAVIALLILARYAFLQIVEFEKYHTQSENNRVHLRPIEPSRGRIYGSKGELLARNLPSFVVTLMRGRMINVKEELATLQRLLNLSDGVMEDFKKRLYQYRAYDAVPMKYELTEKERAILAANRHLLPGVSMAVRFIRQYPYGSLLAHTVGYVGRISEKDQKRLDMEKYNGIYHTGKIGLERTYEEQIKGIAGQEHVETNVRGKVLRSLAETSAEAGKDLRLYIDIETQQRATELMQGETGAVVAIDIKTGGVVSFVSMPNYDSNLFVNGISHADYGLLRDSIDIPLFNRALKGLYPPASTIKPFMALGGLHLGVIDEEYTVRDPGWYRIEGDKRKYRDWLRSGHGNAINMNYAIAQSCDVYFYDLAYRMGVDNMSPFLKAFHFGMKTNIDLVGEKSGLVPNKKWKEERRGRHWFPGDSINMGIGQGFMQSTPIQLAAATAMIAREGVYVEPRIVKSVGNEPVPMVSRQAITLDESHWESVKKAMDNVVNSRYGTGKKGGIGLPFKLAGKTGTAQVVGIKQNEKYDSAALKKKQRDHALFVGFAPYDDPQVAIAVIVENGESGGGRAAPIAGQVAKAYLNSIKEKPSN